MDLKARGKVINAEMKVVAMAILRLKNKISSRYSGPKNNGKSKTQISHVLMTEVSSIKIRLGQHLRNIRPKRFDQ